MSSQYRGEVRPRRQSTRHHIETYAAAHHTHQPDDPFPTLSSKQFPAMYKRDPVKNQYRRYMRGQVPDEGQVHVSKRVLSPTQFNPRAAVDAFPKTSAYDNAIASAQTNAYDQGLREDADDDGHAFWTSVHGEVLSEMDN